MNLMGSYINKKWLNLLLNIMMCDMLLKLPSKWSVKRSANAQSKYF